MDCVVQWANGTCHGAGVWSLDGGGSFRGGHAAGLRDGWGTAVDASGAVYEGQWAAGRRHGLGSQRCEDGSTYVGKFRCDGGLCIDGNSLECCVIGGVHQRIQ